MASVTSLDSDMRKLRSSRYPPAAADSTRIWIEQTLGEKIATGELMLALKDGTILCRLANLNRPEAPLKFKQSAMPFVQMENIANFLKVCASEPLNIPSHDRFLTVDLYERKDPAQVLQCLAAFSRAINLLNPDRFPETIGGVKSNVTAPGGSLNSVSGSMRSVNSISSMKSGPSTPNMRPVTPTKTGGSGTSSSTTTPRSNNVSVSSWSKKDDESKTVPAWNIHQYGYMGGASQGNQGILFGIGRQIVSAAPHVPILSEKERTRREKEAQEQRDREEAEEVNAKDEALRREEDVRRHDEETQKHRDAERQRIDDQKRKWAEEEQQWRADEETKRNNEQEMANVDLSSGAEFLGSRNVNDNVQVTPERRKVRELEKQLEEARERERQYQQDRESRSRQDKAVTNQRSDMIFTTSQVAQAKPSSIEPIQTSSVTDDVSKPIQKSTESRQVDLGSEIIKPEDGLEREMNALNVDDRPLPDPSTYQNTKTSGQNRTDQFLAQNEAPKFIRPTVHQPTEMGTSTTIEQQEDRDRRIASQEKTAAGAWATKSRLEQEMERERERQREWEMNQESARVMSEQSDSRSNSRPSSPTKRSKLLGPRPQPR